MRKRISKQEKRKKETEFKICFSDTELATIAKAAKISGLSRTRYIHEAAIALAGNTGLIPDRAALNHIIQLLALNYALLQEMADAGTLPGIEDITEQMANLERKVLTALTAPHTHRPEP